MAITYSGLVKSSIVFGNDATTQNLFTITNNYASRVNVIVRRLVFQEDAIAVSTAVMPLVKASRATAISGGVILEKGAFDTTQSSDANVIFRSPSAETAGITATPGTILWQGFPIRMHTAVEQQQGINNYMQTLLPKLAAVQDFILRPGGGLLVQVVAAAGTSNALVSNHWFVECAFEEDTISTFAISGTVTLGGSPVTGAKIIVVEADDTVLTNAILREVITTPAGGTWASTIRTGKIGAAFVQYTTGGTYYTAPGSPYLGA